MKNHKHESEVGSEIRAPKLKRALTRTGMTAPGHTMPMNFVIVGSPHHRLSTSAIVLEFRQIDKPPHQNQYEKHLTC
jgi:hypothetical protein